MMNPEPAKPKKQARSWVPIWETNVDENETRYQTKLDTIIEMTVLKILIGPKVTRDKFIGAELHRMRQNSRKRS